MLGYDEELYFDEYESDNDLAHYGTPRHSGRYPWGSGKNPQRGMDFLSKADALKKKGLSETEQAAALGFKTTSELRTAKSQARAARNADFDKAITAQMHQNNNNVSAVARALGTNESTIRGRLKAMQRPITERKDRILNHTMQLLRNEVQRTKGYIDVGVGSNLFINVTESRLDTAVKALQKEGYELVSIRQPEMIRSGQSREMKLLCPQGTTKQDVYNNKDKIHLLNEAGMKINDDGGIKRLGDPISVDPKRIYIRYAEDGGADRDGVIEVRPGVPDLNLGKANYAQVRVLVDNDKYMKGMCHYSEKIPEGYDIVYNTNKTRNQTDKVFKNIDEKYLKDDIRPVDRFGALITDQNKYIDKDGNEKQGVLNIMSEEGKWTNWSDTLAQQFLSKQEPAVAKQQLMLDYTRRAELFEEINNLTNPVLKKTLLKPFADECDAAAVDLKAAAMPRQGWHVILPNPKLKDNEIYAPNYETGEKVCLIRYPHTGPFEMPELTVNNNSRSSKEIIGKNAQDAVCINKNVADRLSGADFDGDTVLVIPNNDGRLKTMPALFKNFDTKEAYPPVLDENGKPVRTAVVGRTPDKSKGEYSWPEQKQMGMISNLITDMTLAGASADELARAVKHSMVVIDVKKHNLDWQRSERENRIQELRDKYQPKEDPTKRGGGASTLLSRSKSEVMGIPDRARAYNVKDAKGNYIVKDGINVKTGELVYRETGKTNRFTDKETGVTEIVPKTISSTRMYEAKDARELMSGPNHEGTLIERVYADYANKCKALANEARKSMVNIDYPRKDPVAAKKYAAEVQTLMASLSEAEKSRPLERLVNIRAAQRIDNLGEGYKNLSRSDKKKERGKALQRAREDLGIKRFNIPISDREWEAIQNNAISPSALEKILSRTDLEALKKRAMPKDMPSLTPAKVSRIKAYANAGRTQAEIAKAMGVSVATIRNALYPKE